MLNKILILTCTLITTLNANLFFDSQRISTLLNEYSDKEVNLIKKDLSVVRSVCFENTTAKNPPIYLATAGAPGAGKTTILERFLYSHPEYKEAAYLDPDARSLKFMVHTYHALSMNSLIISNTDQFDKVIKNAYDKWRAGSNYIALTLIEEAFNHGYSVAHGTTSTGAHVPDLFTKLKENGYQIVLLLCSSPDDFRYDSIDYRNKVIRFYQSAPEDALNKGVYFAQRMSSYFAHADKIYFYWNENLETPEKLAAIWENGEFEIYDQTSLNSFINKYEKDRLSLKEKGSNIPSFQSFLSKR